MRKAEKGVLLTGRENVHDRVVWAARLSLSAAGAEGQPPRCKRFLRECKTFVCDNLHVCLFVFDYIPGGGVSLSIFLVLRSPFVACLGKLTRCWREFRCSLFGTRVVRSLRSRAAAIVRCTVASFCLAKHSAISTNCSCLCGVPAPSQH